MASSQHRAPVIETLSGPVRGRTVGKVAVFGAIPYVAAPIGKLRFRPPEPMAAWTEPRDAKHPGPIAPQLPSRLAQVMGDFDRPQSEDCLTLNVWTPALGRGPVPVLVWLHGGAFTSGSGQLPWYSGQSLADRGNIVVVSVSYRLGALGFLYLPGVADGNMGLLDQIAALRWIAGNIARFGGDPERVTVCGQSAGARSALILMGDSESNRLFHRAILMSGPFGLAPTAPEPAAQSGREFMDLLGIAPGSAEALRQVPVDRLLATTVDLARGRRQFANARLPFDTVADGWVVAADPAAAVMRGAALDIDVLVGTTRDESAAHLAFDPEVAKADHAQVRAAAEAWFGAAGGDCLAELARIWPHATPYTLLVHLATDYIFLQGTVAFAEARAKYARPAYLYRFDWQSPTPRIGACHCIELPFLFNNFADWPGAAMLEGGDPAAMTALALALQDAFIAFVRSGKPESDTIPPWNAYTAPSRMTMRFDTTVEPCGDLAGMRWRRSWGSPG
jgi:para-nitrobenzyl esterase